MTIEFDQAVREAAQRRREGSDVDSIVRFLRECGFDVVDSVRVLKRAGLRQRGEAKKAVFLSPVWADESERHHQLHELLAEVAEQVPPTDRLV